jgi:KipI family sensor histidine kinase inhibitor
MADAGVAIAPFGDAAILITLERATDETAMGVTAAARWDDTEFELAARAQAIAALLDEARAATQGLGRAVPAAASVLLPFDPLVFELEDAIGLGRRAVAQLEAAAQLEATTGRDTGVDGGSVDGAEPAIEIAVRYGGDDGPDLAFVAEHAGLTPADVVELHAGATYRVLFLGFAPGFGYLGGLPAPIATPRRASPRDRVPAGSVGIAGRQTAIYPRSMPGGWQLIGRTDVALFDPDRPEPALLHPVAAVRFVPVR